MYSRKMTVNFCLSKPRLPQLHAGKREEVSMDIALQVFNAGRRGAD